MAYTYDDFLGAATKSGYLNSFDEDDLNTTRSHPEYGLSMLGLKRDYDNAKTDEQRLLIGETVNQLRSSYRPTGTGTVASSGSGTGAVSSAQNAPTAAGTAAAATTAQQTGATQVAGVKPVSSEGFSYNYEEDPSFQAYRKQYLREGDRATANALGQAAAASAGRASSYAVNAATQAGDYYAGQLADKVPTLYENAYNRYLTDQQNAASNQESAYNNLAAQIIGYGYMPGEEELAQAGMSSELAQQMYQSWIANNPDAAYYQGAITPEQYRQLTGKWPNGYSTGGGGGGKSNWLEEYTTLVNDPSVSSQAINAFVTQMVAAGNISAAQAQALTEKGRNRSADTTNDKTIAKQLGATYGDRFA